MKISFQKVIYLITFLIVTSACSKQENNIIGNWRATSYLYENCDNPLNNYTLFLTSDKCNPLEQNCNQSNIIFNDDNTFSLEFPTQLFDELESHEGSYTISGSNIQLCFNTCIDFILEDEYIIHTFNSESSGCVVTLKYIME